MVRTPRLDPFLRSAASNEPRSRAPYAAWVQFP